MVAHARRFISSLKNGQPRKLHKNLVGTLPASGKWFTEDGSCLNEGYLGKHGTSLVPMEYTRRAGNNISSFHRGETPLAVFMAWAKLAAQSDVKEVAHHLYIAQAEVSNLPRCLQDDLPVPQLVLDSGHDNIYACNLWIGMCPTDTPLHRDPNHNVLVQLAGRKIIKLYNPEAGAKVLAIARKAAACPSTTPFRGDEMMLGPERRALDHLVWASDPGSDVPKADDEICVESGDGVFVPQAWWHSVRGVGKGITASVNWWFR